jgi:large subunit ribosomal protein L32
MPNPKKRKTTSAKNQRRSHHALKPVNLSVCEKCGSAKKPHYACPVCGFYNGNETRKKKEVVKKVENKKASAAEGKKAKAAKAPKKEEKKQS